MRFASHHGLDVSRLHREGCSVHLDLEVAVEQLESLFLLHMVVCRVLLPRKHDDQLLAVLAVYNAYDDRSELPEVLHAVVVRKLNIKFVPKSDPGFVKHTFRIMDNASHDTDVA